MIAADDLQALKKAAEQGDARAQFNLGTMYYTGQGVPEDRVQAYAWYSIVAAQGVELAKENKEIIAEKMTPTEIAKAQELSRKYWEAYGPDRRSE